MIMNNYKIGEEKFLNMLEFSAPLMGADDDAVVSLHATMTVFQLKALAGCVISGARQTDDEEVGSYRADYYMSLLLGEVDATDIKKGNDYVQ